MQSYADPGTHRVKLSLVALRWDPHRGQLVIGLDKLSSCACLPQCWSAILHVYGLRIGACVNSRTCVEPSGSSLVQLEEFTVLLHCGLHSVLQGKQECLLTCEVSIYCLLALHNVTSQRVIINPFKPEFKTVIFIVIVIFIHYKPRIAHAILDL